MILCPKCGSDYREARQCPQYDGKPVCIRCCRECGYYDPAPMGLRCRWYIHHPRIDYRSEIEKLNRQIQTKERQIERFYENNKPWVAEKIEAETSWLRNDRREMERKQNEEDKKNGNAI